MNENLSHHERLDQATSRRLAKLLSMPVDLTQAQSRLGEMIERERGRRSSRRWPTWMGLAASVAIAAVLSLIIYGTRPVYAAPAEMVRLHREMVTGLSPAIPVDNIDEARRAILAEWPDAPPLPSISESDEDVHACCLAGVQSRKVACVLLRRDGVPVTIVVARAKDFRSAKGTERTVGGQRYTVQSRDGINMVMTRQHDRWLCFMAELAEDELIVLASNLTHH